MNRLSDENRLALLESPVGRIRAVLDTDTFDEIDDQFALVQALLSPDRIGLEAIYAAPFHNSRSTPLVKLVKLIKHQILLPPPNHSFGGRNNIC